MRGNKSYAYYQSERLENIQRAIDKDKIVEGNRTNILFLTLTHEYNPENFESIKESWQIVPERLPKFTRKIKKIVNLKHYVEVLEAHEQGGCHAHAAIVLNQPITCQKINGILRVPDSVRDKIRAAWGENIDVRGADSSAIAGYLTKELGKSNHVEDAIKRARKGEETASDRKKLWAYYWADVLGIRLLRVSKSLPKVELDEDDPERLDYDCDKSTDEPDEIIEIVKLDKKSAFKIPGFEPWTGEISPDAPEYPYILPLFQTLRKTPVNE